MTSGSGISGQGSEMKKSRIIVSLLYSIVAVVVMRPGLAEAPHAPGDYTAALPSVEKVQAHAKAPYTVDNTQSGFMIHVQNPRGAFLLAVGLDANLRGSGSTAVSRRLVSSIQDGNVTFIPHSETCAIGTLVARGERNTMHTSSNLEQERR
jgi:hypothetical protein